jgi:glycosyltransferase involved in cell wall biosynthesis
MMSVKKIKNLLRFLIKGDNKTLVHPRYDTRIFLKECKTLSDAGFDANLIVADGKGDEAIDKIKIYDVGNQKNRKERMFKTTKKVFQEALEVDADIYRFYNPELIPNTIDINNSPLLNEFYSIDLKNNKENAIYYVGGITKIRGIVELITSLEYVDTTFHLAGEFESENLKKEVMQLPGWKKKLSIMALLIGKKLEKFLQSVNAGIATFCLNQIILMQCLINFLDICQHLYLLLHQIFLYGK